MLIDSHVHLDDARYDADRDAMLARARAAGVGTFITIGTHLQDSEWACAFAAATPDAYATVGLHPELVDRWRDDTDLALYRQLALRDKVVAIGEVGLDYHHGNEDRSQQQRVFCAMIRLSRELELPLVIHQREAAEDTLRILREEKAGAFGGVFHCFAGDLATAQAAMGLGFRIAVGGVMTFPNAGALREVVKALPLSALMLETDGPWLAPQSQRGQRNEPAFLPAICQKLAEVKGISVAEAEAATTANALDTFYLNSGDQSTIGYPLKGGFYINLTNRCTDSCTFCDRRRSNPKGNHIQGLNLTLRREPTVAEVLRAIGDPKRYEEVVFCGFGEPTLRLDALKAIARDLAGRGVKVRLNTNGHGNKLHGRDITPELAEAGVHTASVSLNAQDADTYQRICRSSYPAEEAYQAVKDFIKAAKASMPHVVASAVTVPQTDIAACRKIAEQELGVEFRVRGFEAEL